VNVRRRLEQFIYSRRNTDAREIDEGLRELLGRIYGRVANDVFQAVGSVAHSIVEALPTGGSDAVGGFEQADPNVNLIRQTALSYLPEALNAYLAIPRVYAESRPVQDGKTAHDLLMEQLTVMDAKIRDVSDAIARNDTDRLMANVRFLQERYATSALEPRTVSADSDAASGTATVV